MYRITRFLEVDDPFLSDCAKRINKDFPKKARVMPNSNGPGYAVFVDDVYYDNALAKVSGCSVKVSSKIKVSEENQEKARLALIKLRRYLYKAGLPFQK